MEVESFAEIEQEFIERVHRMVWCNVATIDTNNHPRSRVLHPMWEGSVGWIMTGRHTVKTKHLAHSPHVSLTYMADVFKPVYIDGTAKWVDDATQKVRIWNLFKNTPPPLGYDNAQFFGSAENPEYGLLKITPTRIELADLFGSAKVWSQR
jgi:general stress protein 26